MCGVLGGPYLSRMRVPVSYLFPKPVCPTGEIIVDMVAFFQVIPCFRGMLNQIVGDDVQSQHGRLQDQSRTSVMHRRKMDQSCMSNHFSEKLLVAETGKQHILKPHSLCIPDPGLCALQSIRSVMDQIGIIDLNLTAPFQGKQSVNEVQGGTREYRR